MRSAELHRREAERLALLRELAILDTATESDYDGLAKAAAVVAGTPIAFVSLLDKERQWFKARVGLEIAETNREIAFCAHAIHAENQALVVEDAREDARFADNPLVLGSPQVVFYAGLPLRVGPEALPVGTLCAVDSRPRHLAPEQLEALKTLARQVEILLEQRLRRRQLQEVLGRLEQERNQIEAVFDSMHDGVVVQEADGAISFCNVSAQRILGLSEAQMAGRTSFDERWSSVREDGSVFPGNEHPSMVCLATGQPVNGVVMGVGIGGARRWIRINCAPIKGASDPKERRVVCSFSDITELRCEEQARRLAESSVQNLFNTSLDVLCALDRQGRFIRLNRSWRRVLDFSAEEMLGHHFNEFIHPDDRQASQEVAETLLAGKDLVAFSNRFLCKDGGYRTLAWTAVFEPQQGVIFASGRDITEQRRDESELKRAKEAAEEAVAAKSTFLATMSHEIRTPMAGVIGLLNLIIETRLDGVQRLYAESARTSAESLLQILNEILDFSKIDSGQMRIERIAFDPAALVLQCTSLFKQPARMKGIELNHVCEIPNLLCLSGDPSRIKQVLLNLLSNAIKFTSKGSVLVRAETHPVGGDSVDFVISVSDTGIGIPDEALARLFAPFTQADASTSRQFGGTGLGLTITRSLCELMGGTISVESVPGAGSTFTATIRCPKAEPIAAPPAKPIEPARFFSGRVLIADDVETNVIVASALLGKLGMHVEHAANGAQACEIVKHSDFDLIIMDCRMPVIDGFEATRRIREREAGCSRTPIIALTANAFDDDRARCLAAGMDGFLTKPIRRSELIETLGRWLPHKLERRLESTVP